MFNKKNMALYLIIAFAIFSILIFAFQIKKTPSLSPKQNLEFLFDAKQLENFGSTKIPTEQQETAEDGQCGPICQTFTKSREIENIYEGVSIGDAQELDKLQKQLVEEMLKFLRDTNCPAECEEAGKTYRITRKIEPVNPIQSGDSCSGGGTIDKFTVTGSSLLGCGAARLNALNKILKIMNQGAGEICPNGCGWIAETQSKVTKDCWGWPTSKIEVQAEAKITCTGKPKNNKYKVTLEGTACVNCKPKPKSSSGATT